MDSDTLKGILSTLAIEFIFALGFCLGESSLKYTKYFIGNKLGVLI